MGRWSRRGRRASHARTAQPGEQCRGETLLSCWRDLLEMAALAGAPGSEEPWQWECSHQKLLPGSAASAQTVLSELGHSEFMAVMQELGGKSFMDFLWEAELQGSCKSCRQCLQPSKGRACQGFREVISLNPGMMPRAYKCTPQPKSCVE